MFQHFLAKERHSTYNIHKGSPYKLGLLRSHVEPMGRATNGRNFGQIVLEHRFATPEQVNECLTIQSQVRAMGIAPKNLGEILLEKNYITKEQAAAVLRMQGQEGPQTQIPGYEIIVKLGQGAMGAVFKARQVSMDRLVALKVLAPRFAKDTAFVTRFVREARTVAKLHHQNIISGIDVGEHEGIHYFVMEYVDGETVGSLLRKSGAMPEKQALNIALQITKALDHANANSMVHRDIKPDNIMLTCDGVAKLCDLGLARQEGIDASLTQAGQTVGTPHYISPEQASGEKDIDIRSDIYSLGATLYHMILGSTPYPPGTASVVMAKHLTELVPPLKDRQPGVSAAVSEVVAKMMKKNRAERYQTPAELLTDISNILEDYPPAHVKVEMPRLIVKKPPVVPHAAGKDGQRDTYRRSRSAGGILVGVVSILVVASAGYLANRFLRDGEKSATGGGPPVVEKKEEKKPPQDEPAGNAAIDRELDRKAKEELDAILARQSRMAADLTQMATVEARFDEFLNRYEGTKWEVEGLNAQQKFRQECEGLADAAMAALLAKVKPFEESGRLHEASLLFDEFPKEFLKTGVMQRGLTEKTRLLEAINSRFSADLAAVEELLQKKEFDRALAILEAVKVYSSPKFASEADSKAKVVENEKQAYASSIRTRAQELYTAFQKELWSLLDRKKKDYAAAKHLAEGAFKNPEMAFMKSEIREDLRDVDSLIEFWRDVERGIDKCVATKEVVQLLMFKDFMGKLVRKDKKIYFETSVGGGSSFMALDLDRLKDEDIFFFTGKVIPTDDGPGRLKIGLYCFYAGNFKKAKECFQKAAEKGEVRANVYLERIQAAAISEEDGKACALFAEAQDLIKAQKFAEAHKILSELIAQRADLPFVKEKLEEIKKLIADIEAKMAAADAHPLQKLVKGKVKKLPGDRVEVFYDFSKEDQMSDWEPGQSLGGGGGEWRRGEDRSGLLGENCSRPFYWKTPTVGDVAIEVSVTVIDDRNVGLTICDDKQGRAYLGALGMELPRIDERFMNFSPNVLMKTNLRRGFDPTALRELGGRTTPRLVRGATLVLKLQKVGKQVAFAAGADVIANTTDTEFTRGFISLWLLNSSAFFNSVKITCTIDPEWLKGPSEQPPR